MKKIFRVIFSKEYFFALFILAGYFKGEAASSIFDATVILLGITVVLAIKDVFLEKFEFPKYIILPICLFLVFIMIAIFSITYTPSDIYVKEKIVRLLGVTVWCFIGGFLLIKDQAGLERFLLGFLSVGVVMGVTAMYEIITVGIQGMAFVSVLGSDYIALGRAASMGAIILLTYFIFSSANKKMKTIALILSLLLIIPLIASGGRLPIVTFVASVACIPFFLFRIKKGKIYLNKNFKKITFFLVAAVTGVFYLMERGFLDFLLFRFNEISGGSVSALAESGRLDRIQASLDMIGNNIIFGQGIGSFPIVYSGIDAHDSPHNIFLEVFSEMGLLAFIIIVALVTISFYNGIIAYKRKKGEYNYIQISLILLSVFSFITVLISGSINSSKFFWAFACMMIISPYLNKSEVKRKIKITL